MHYKRHTRRLFCLKKDVVTISITGKAREYSRSQWRANSYEKDTALEGLVLNYEFYPIFCDEIIRAR